MNRRSDVSAATLPIMLTLLLPATVLAADAAPRRPDRPPPASGIEQLSDEELDEVLVEGRKPNRNPQQVMVWLTRLVGQYTYEGYVDLRGKGRPEDQQPVQGFADCVARGPAPAVQCAIKVSWPDAKGPNGEEILGGASALDPAVLLLGYEPNRFGIRYMMVDSKGVAEGALGLLYGDTLISKAPCVNIPGNCQRAVRITASPDLKVIETQIDLEIDSRRVVHFQFVQRRVPGSSITMRPGQQERPRQ